MTHDDAPRVVIIGGGLAGMAAAAALSESPLRVELYEARRRTGGRAGSFTDPASGQTVDYCQHVAMGCCTNFLRLLEWADLEEAFQRDAQLTFLAEGTPRSLLAPSDWLPPPLHLAPAFGRLRFLTPDERGQVRRGLWRLMRLGQSTRPHDDVPVETMGHWLRRIGQSETTLNRFWNVVLASALGDHVDRVAIGPARQVFIEGFLRARRASDLLIPREPLAEIFGRRLPERLSQRGVGIHRGVRIRGCGSRRDGRFDLDTGAAEPLVADDVVVAAAWHGLPRLFGSSPLAAAIPELEAIGGIPAAPISGIHLWLDRPVTELPHAVIIGRLSQWIFRDPVATREEAPLPHESREHYYQVVVSAAHDLRGRPAGEIEAEVVSDLRAVFPEAGPLRAVRSRVVTDPAAVFSIRPDVERLRPKTETARPGLYLAGDWVQTGWPATMEGAVLSGFRAAEAICRRYGLDGRWVQPPLAAGRLSQWIVAR